MGESQVDNRGRFRTGVLVVLLVSFALIVHYVFGPNGYLASRRQQQQLQTLHQRIVQMQQENDVLDQHNRDLKTNPEAVEQIAREQMHLVKPGEKIYTRENVPNAAPQPTAAPH